MKLDLRLVVKNLNASLLFSVKTVSTLIGPTGVAAVAYWLTGFALAFGPGNHFIGWRFWATSEYSDDGLSHFFLEMVIAATCSTIVSGSVVGRCKMVGYLIYSFIITGKMISVFYGGAERLL